MKKIVFLFLLVGVFAFADAGMSTFSNFQAQYKSSIAPLLSTFQGAAKSLLISFFVIELVITFGLMAARGNLEITGAFGEFAKQALIFGFFLAVIKSPQLFTQIYNGFDKLGITAGGPGADLNKFIDNLIDMWSNIVDQLKNANALNGLGTAFAAVIVGVLVTIPLVLMLGNALELYAFAILSCYVGIFWLGFGSYSQTRNYAIHAITNVVRWGAKWMVQIILISIAFDFVNNLSETLTAARANDNLIQTMVGLAMTALVLLKVNDGIGAWVDSYFTGVGGPNTSAGQTLTAVMGAVAGGAAGAVAGAVASPAVQASKAASEAAGGAGKPSIGSRVKGAMSGALQGGQHGFNRGLGDVAIKSVTGNFADVFGGKTSNNNNNNGSNNNNQTIDTKNFQQKQEEIQVAMDSESGNSGTISKAQDANKENG